MYAHINPSRNWKICRICFSTDSFWIKTSIKLWKSWKNIGRFTVSNVILNENQNNNVYKILSKRVSMILKKVGSNSNHRSGARERLRKSVPWCGTVSWGDFLPPLNIEHRLPCTGTRQRNTWPGTAALFVGSRVRRGSGPGGDGWMLRFQLRYLVPLPTLVWCTHS